MLLKKLVLTLCTGELAVVVCRSIVRFMRAKPVHASAENAGQREKSTAARCSTELLIEVIINKTNNRNMI